MKKNWKTVLVSGSALALLVGMLAVPSMATVGKKTVTLDYHNVSVTLDGQKLDLRDGSGNVVEPFTLNGTTYLPVAAVSKALGLNVAWDGQSHTVMLTRDSYSIPDGTYIGENKAKEIALKHAGLAASQVTFLRTQLEYEDGRVVYDVEFWKDVQEYDYEIDAVTGAILSYDQDIEGYRPSTPNQDIGAEKAKEIALKHAGVTAAQAQFVQVKTDWEHGRLVYDVEFYCNNKEYDYEIDGATGQILSYDFDIEGYIPQPKPETGTYISEQKVKQIVEKKAGVTGFYKELKLEMDDGRMVYEGELVNGRSSYEFTIDAVSGTILDWEVDWD